MRVLCAVDGSEFSQWGVRALEALASREPEHVTLLHIVEARDLKAARRAGRILGAQRALSASEKAGRILLREAERLARVALSQAVTGPRTTFHTALAYGPVPQTIARQARRLKSDLIIIGSRGLSDIKGFLMGSLSRQVVSMAPCPVFVVKQPTVSLTRVALAVDDSKHSRAAARFLRSQFLPESATVTILSSAESPGYGVGRAASFRIATCGIDATGARTDHRPGERLAERLNQGGVSCHDQGAHGSCDRYDREACPSGT